MPPILFRKKARSSAFAKPASWDVLCSRTSMTFFTPELSRRSKKPSAVVWVKPIVATVALANRALRLRLRLQAPGLRARPRLAGGRHGGAARRRLDHGFARRPLAHEQILDLVAGQRLELEQALGQRLEIGALVGEYLLRLGIAGLDQPPDLA